MTDDTLTRPERQYLLRRLGADDIKVFDDEDALALDLFDIPVIIADREILALYTASDRRMTEMLAEGAAPKMVIVEHQAPTEPVNTWRHVNRREKWAWIGIGAAGTLAICVVGLLAFGIWISS